MSLTPEEVQAQNREFTLTREALKPLPEPHLTGMKLEGNIVLGDFIFNTTDSYGVTWVITDINGWWKHPTAEVNDIPRGYGDGSYDVQGRYQARSLSLSGSILTPDPSLLEAARDRLTAASNLVYRGAWLKTGTNPIRASWVRLVDQVEMSTVTARGRTDFTIPLRASDPIKYAWNDADPDGYFIEEFQAKNALVPGSGSTFITNIGNYPVPVLFELIGPFTGPGTILNKTTNELIIITQGLAGASSSVIENKQLSFDENNFVDIATITTKEPHGFLVGAQINISGVDEVFDGDYIVSSIPTDTTFTYEKVPTNSEIYLVTNKTLESAVATLDTEEDHEISVGDTINVFNVDAVFNGEYTVTDVPSSKKVSYTKTRTPPVDVTGAVLVSNTATLTTSVAHNFIVGDSVTVSDLRNSGASSDNDNYNGTFTITNIPSSRQFSYAATRTNARTIIQVEMGRFSPNDDVISLKITTDLPHNFIEGESVSISEIDSTFDGTYTVSSIVSSTVFLVQKDRPTVKTVSTASRFSNSVALTTSEEHGLIVGEKIEVINVGSSVGDTSINGVFTTTGAPGGSTITYTENGSTIPATTVIDGSLQPKSRRVSSRSLQGNVASITTKNPHGAFVGESVTISGMDNGTFNGTYTITSTPTANTFTYNKNASNIATKEIYESNTSAFAELSGTIPVRSINGSASVAGTLPFTSVTGTAAVGEEIPRVISPGFIVKKNEVQFTPGVDGIALRDADILEIETKDREVAFNGEIVGARGRIDVLAEFIQLAPGENNLELRDEGNPESDCVMRVYYRSGWLS